MRSGPAQNQIVYRDDEGFHVIGEIDRDPAHRGPDASQAVQFALERAAACAGEVRLQPGTYPLDRPVLLRSGATLRGAGRGSRLVVTGENDAGVAILAERAHGVLVADLACHTDDGGVAGVVLEACGDSKVHRIAATGFTEYGIWSREGSFLCEVSQCSLAGNAKAGVFFDHHHEGEYGQYIPNLISQCVCYGGGKGIECRKTTVMNIVGCLVYQTRDVAYHIHDWSCSVLISGCRTFQVAREAVVAEEASELNVSSNIFCWHEGHGLVVRDCAWGVIAGNEIIDTGSVNADPRAYRTPMEPVRSRTAQYDGIRLCRTSGFNIAGNTVFNWPQGGRMRNGIVEDERCSDNRISGNSINYYTGEAIVPDGTNTALGANAWEKERAHIGVPLGKQTTDCDWLQCYQPQKTQQFVDLIRSLGGGDEA